MNTYDENLNDSITASFDKQQLNEFNARSSLNAATFNLFYAQDALMKAHEKEVIAKGSMLFKKKVKDQAVRANDISKNLSKSAHQANHFLKTSVKNTAVCAANVLAAANATVKLAGEIGGIYSMVHAAEANSDIDKLTQEVYNLVNKTAYAAEKSSQHAMELSTRTSEVSTSNVVDNSKYSGQIMLDLLNTVSSEFELASKAYTDDNKKLATASTRENEAEGSMVDKYVDFKSVRSASRLMNQELNLNLRVTSDQSATDPSGSADNTTETGTKDYSDNNTSSYTSGITEITAPYNANDFSLTVQFDPILNPFKDNTDIPDPVQNYYAVIVKMGEQGLFTLAEAENLLMMDTNSPCIPCTASSPNVIKVPYPNDQSQPVLDSDCDAVQPGQDYVVFILAIFTEKYKKTLNYFDDFLSAPSAPFSLKLALPVIDATTITFPEIPGQTDQFLVSFPIDSAASTIPVEYRCLFLPYSNITQTPGSKLIPENLASYHWFKRFIKEADEIVEIYHAEFQTEKKPQKSNSGPTQGKAPEAPKTNIEAAPERFDTQIKEFYDDTLGFYVTLPILENIPSSNYITARQKNNPPNQSTNTSLVTAKIDMDTTTDIFGNLLYISNPVDPSVSYSYKVVVLSAYNGLDEDMAQYLNALSSIEHAPIIKASEQGISVQAPVK